MPSTIAVMLDGIRICHENLLAPENIACLCGWKDCCFPGNLIQRAGKFPPPFCGLPFGKDRFLESP